MVLTFRDGKKRKNWKNEGQNQVRGGIRYEEKMWNKEDSRSDLYGKERERYFNRNGWSIQMIVVKR